jgi:hypothetical protein
VRFKPPFPRGLVSLGWIFVSFVAVFPVTGADSVLTGRVVDENGAPVQSVRIAVSLDPNGSWQTQTDATGGFKLTLPNAGDFLVSAERQGYYTLKDRPVRIDATQEVTLKLNSVRDVFQSIDVTEQPSPVDVGQLQNQERLTGTQMNEILYPNSHSLRSSLPLMPGVVQDAAGSLHVNGSSENQVEYLLNGFNLTDPVSGQFKTLLGVEGIRSLDLSSGRNSAEFGKGSAGVLAIATETGTDTFHSTATDFIPGLSIQHGFRLGNWYPRWGFSGPIVRGRAWFSDNLDLEYNQALVPGLPSGQNTNSHWAGSNLLHTQLNLTPSHILFGDFLINFDNQGRSGLGALSPVSTTTTVHTREYFASIKDQVYLGRGVLVEFGYARNEFSNVQTPQGQGLYVFSPAGVSGNYFVTSTQTASRDQGILHTYLPQFQVAGSHQLEVGADGDLLHYHGEFHRTGYEVTNVAGQILSETLFRGLGIFRLSDVEMSSFLLDTWRISKRFQLNLGVRQDWDQRVDSYAVSPRLAFSWAPVASGRTKLSGGYSVTHDTVTLDMLGRPLDQIAATTTFNPDGTPAGTPALTSFILGNAQLKLPQAANWSLNLDRQWPARIYTTAKYLRRRGTDEFAFVNTLAPNGPPSLLPLSNGASPGIYQLTNLRRDDFDSVQVSVRQALAGQYEWMASYTRSRAQSNVIIDPNSAQALQVLPNFAPMPWDSPNRILGWGYFPLPLKNFSASVLADMRSGFPFSVRQQNGMISGTVDSYRYPINFNLNVAIERMMAFHGYRFALRVGVDNLTNQANPTAVNNVVGSPQYLQFFGKEGRHFVLRIRFYGRAKGK